MSLLTVASMYLYFCILAGNPEWNGTAGHEATRSTTVLSFQDWTNKISLQYPDYKTEGSSPSVKFILFLLRASC